jgi:penicillin-binding protein 2
MGDHNDNKSWFIYGVIVFFGIVLLVKAIQLQLFDNTFRAKGMVAGIEKAVIYPERGLIYDRNDSLLLFNTLTYDLMVTVNKINPDMDTAGFCKLLGIDTTYFRINTQKDWTSAKFSKNIAFPFLKKISPESFARFQERLHEFPGFTTQRRSIRLYPQPHAAHILGYIREADQAIIERSEGKYKPGDYLGASGLEKSYEDMLRGQKGISYFLKDNVGRRVAPYKEGDLDSMPASGSDLVTSLDIKLQAYGEELMKQKIGSIVALDPSTGEVLCMVTSPSFDPNLLTIDRNRGEAYSRLLTDPNKPLFDRSLMAKYPPGSIFKTVLSLVALEEGFTKPDKPVTCNGAYTLGNYSWGCRNHPPVTDLATALQYSCNTYYYQLFRNMVDRYSQRKVDQGLDTLRQKLMLFGLGTRLGVDLPGETAGFLPNSDLYNKMYGVNRWRSSSIISLGIGQGEILMNTLQMANLAATIANRGWYRTPHMVKSVIDTSKISIPVQTERMDCGVESRHFEPVIEGMYRAVAAGSAASAFLPDIAICGKTGTSQNPHGDDHSVFIAFAPRENPKIAVAVYVENSGYGGRFAAPIASLIIEKYLTGQIRESRKWLESNMINANLIYTKS